VYEDLKGSVEDKKRETRPRFDLGLDTRELIGRLDLFADLSEQQLERVQKLLKPLFVAPRELIVREGDQGDACYFIASGAAEVALSGRRIPLGSGDLFGEMALLTGMTRQADVVAMTYCRLLVLRKVDFDRFMQDNGDIRQVIHKIAASRSSMNRADETGVGLA
jgi:CPA1 family monovalent cation:H+ antiporter